MNESDAQHIARRRKIFTRRHLSEIGLVGGDSRSLHRGVGRQMKARVVHVGKRRVEGTMWENGLLALGKRRFRVSTTDSNHALPIAPNLLARRFTVDAPNTVWSGDMTSLKFAIRALKAENRHHIFCSR